MGRYGVSTICHAETWLTHAMTSYDFTSINDKEFEHLVADLLSSELGVHVERFKPGPDSGVDGRWFSTTGDEIVVQCKHWVRSGYKQLLSHMKRHEKPKVDALAPARYLLATSVPMSRRQKQELTDLLAPHVLNPADILGPEDLNDLLGQHPNVEKQHFKLWISSTHVLTVVLNSAVLGRSRAELEEIHEEASIYAPTADYERARAHLTKHRIMVLTGEPGIGKTTLARQLILEHCIDDFALVVLEEDISEGEAVFVDDQRQIFYFDDFLGRTYLEALKAKQDSHIASFARRIAKSPNKRLILTSRTNILNQGRVLSDLFSEAPIENNRYELHISNLSELDKAHILYNHVWHSALSADYIDEIYKDKRYRTIVAHKNFNPRLIAFILDSDKVAAVPPPDYWPYVLRTLNSPDGVWQHFFSSQLSQPCRDLVYIAALNGYAIGEDDLREAFLTLPAHAQADQGLAYHNFHIAQRHAVGSVLNRSMRAGGGVASYSLFNPSIADYVHGYLADSGLWAYYFPHIRTLAALAQLEQMYERELFDTATYRKILRTTGAVEQQGGQASDAYALRLARLLAHEPELLVEFKTMIEWWLSLEGAVAGGRDTDDYVKIVVACERIAEPTQFADHLRALPELLADHHSLIGAPDASAALLGALNSLGFVAARDQVRSIVLAEFEAEIWQTITDEGLLDDYHSPQDSDLVSEALAQFVRARLEAAGVEPSWSEVVSVCEAVDPMDVIEMNIERLNALEDQADGWREVGYSAGSAAEIDDLFERTAR
jgi:MoxR-like ATPase